MSTNITSSMLQKAIQLQKENKSSEQNNSSGQIKNTDNKKAKKINKKKLACSLAAAAGLSALALGIIYSVKGGKKSINQPTINKPLLNPENKIVNPPSFESKPVEAEAVIEKLHQTPQTTPSIVPPVLPSSVPSVVPVTPSIPTATSIIPAALSSTPSITPPPASRVKAHGKNNIKAGMKIFLDKDNNEVQGVQFKKGAATFADGRKFDGTLKTKNKKGDMITIKFTPNGLIEESNVNDSFKKKYCYPKFIDHEHVVREYDKAGKERKAFSVKIDEKSENNSPYKLKTFTKLDRSDNGKVKKTKKIFDDRYGLIQKTEELYIGDYRRNCLNSSLDASFNP